MSKIKTNRRNSRSIGSPSNSAEAEERIRIHMIMSSIMMYDLMSEFLDKNGMEFTKLDRELRIDLTEILIMLFEYRHNTSSIEKGVFYFKSNLDDLNKIVQKLNSIDSSNKKLKNGSILFLEKRKDFIETLVHKGLIKFKVN